MITLKISGRVLRDLDNEVIPDSELGRVISATLARAQKAADPIKVYELAIRFRRCQDIELDDSDYELVRDLIKKDSSLTAIGAGQMLKLLKDSETEEEHEKNEQQDRDGKRKS